MRETLRSYCKRMELNDLLEQWDTARNLPLTPDHISYGSKQKVWWQCKEGHSWQAMVYTRTGSGVGCPACAGKVVQVGKNDLATLYPDLARQWHPTKNGNLIPKQVVPGSHRVVWWICEKGHEWRAQIKSRVSGCGCPVCAGRQVVAGENDLASQFPAIAAQWHPTKNGVLTPQQVTPSSNRKVWWRCKMGHDYTATVAARTMRSSGCPYCSGKKVLCGFNDLATLKPDLAKQWHPTLNGTLTPEMVTAGAHRKVWWICPEGHVWIAIIYSRTGPQKCGCPICAGKVKGAQLERYAKMVETAMLR